MPAPTPGRAGSKLPEGAAIGPTSASCRGAILADRVSDSARFYRHSLRDLRAAGIMPVG